MAGSVSGAASGAQSAVIASGGAVGCTAARTRSAVIASEDSTVDTAGSNSAVLASVDCDVEGTCAAAIASDDCDVVGTNAAALASDTCPTSGTCAASVATFNSAVSGSWAAGVAAYDCIVSGDKAAAVASNNTDVTGTRSGALGTSDCTVDGDTSAVLASDLCATGAAAQEGAVIGSVYASVTGLRCVVAGSTGTGAVGSGNEVENRTSHSVAGGIAGGGGPTGFGVNLRWLLDSTTGNYWSDGLFVGPGVDYAEMIENGDGDPHGPGELLSFRDGTVVRAVDGDRIAGVVSVAATVVGGESAFGWHGRRQRDEWGRVVLGDDGRPQLKADNDQARAYKRRGERPAEWTQVGLLGQLRVGFRGELAAGDFVMPGKTPGVGVRASDEYIDDRRNRRAVEVLRVERKSTRAAVGIALCFVSG